MSKKLISESEARKLLGEHWVRAFEQTAIPLVLKDTDFGCDWHPWEEESRNWCRLDKNSLDAIDKRLHNQEEFRHEKVRSYFDKQGKQVIESPDKLVDLAKAHWLLRTVDRTQREGIYDYGTAIPKNWRIRFSLLDDEGQQWFKNRFFKNGQLPDDGTRSILSFGRELAKTQDADGDASEGDIRRTSGNEAESTDNSLGQFNLLHQFHNLVLEGVPGTGKTYAFGKLKNQWMGERDADDHFAMTLHPSTSYEDFVEGLRPSSVAPDGEKSEGKEKPEWFFEPVHAPKDSTWGVADGFFVKACSEAAENPEKDYLVLLDEINRANVPQVFGDLITTVEHSKRAVWLSKNDKEGKEVERPEKSAPIKDKGYWVLTEAQVVQLPYSRREFFVPGNVYVVATMNTSDRSVAPLDSAMRRRFAFERLEPMKASVLKEKLKEKFGETFAAIDTDVCEKMYIDIWEKLNDKLEETVGPDAKLGHSYFFDIADEIKRTKATAKMLEDIVRNAWHQQILPQLIDTLVGTNQQKLLTKHAKSPDHTLASVLEELGTLELWIRRCGEGLNELPRVLTKKPPTTAPEKKAGLEEAMGETDTASEAESSQDAEEQGNE